MLDIETLLNTSFPGRGFTAQSQLIDDALIDSVDIILLVDAIEKEFGVSVPGDQVTPENFQEIATIRMLVSKLVNGIDFQNDN